MYNRYKYAKARAENRWAIFPMNHKPFFRGILLCVLAPFAILAILAVSVNFWSGFREIASGDAKAFFLVVCALISMLPFLGIPIIETKWNAATRAAKKQFCRKYPEDGVLLGFRTLFP